MDSYQRFKEKFFVRLSRMGEDGWKVRPSLLAFDYRVPDAQVKILLYQWASEGLLWLAAEDDGAVREWNTWTSAEEMFSAQSGGNAVKLKMLPRGAEYVETIPKSLRATVR